MPTRLNDAAPELLAACKKALPELQALYESVIDDVFQAAEVLLVISQVRNAICKAEGKPCPPN
jgi:hypothetical protein